MKAKARLVAKGYRQVQGIDYMDTYAPTPSLSSIRLLCAHACATDFPLYHLDAEQAFVQSNLREEIYMRLPQGCKEDSGKVVMLNRGLYGLKQAGREWSSLLSSTLIKLGFEHCMADPCVFRLMDGEVVRTLVLAHVDDRLTVSSYEDCTLLRDELSEFFPVKDLGGLNCYMGCNFDRDAREQR